MSSVGGKKRKTAASGVASKSMRDNRPVGDENCSGNSNGVGEPEQQMIDYTPHYEVLVKEGATHFDSVSAAIFEHIDNSITAFKILPPEYERKVEVQIHVPAKGLYDAEPIYLAIWDNAGGMTTKQLEAYFTAALGRETRGLEPKGKGEATARMAHLAGNLSKFGVGALQSFAYLGTQLKVITKDKEEGKVRYYKIDKDYFKQKEESHGRDSVFKGAVRVVETAEKALEEVERRTQLVQHLQQWDELPHFTCVLIRLQDIHKREIFETQGSKILYDLADVFYYYLKPDAFPSFPERANKRPNLIALGKDAVVSTLAEKRAKTRSGQSVGSAAAVAVGGRSSSCVSGGEGSGGIRENGNVGDDGERERAVEMSVAYFKENSTREVRTVLKDEVLKECLEGKYWEETEEEDVFTATFQVDDPRFVPLEDHCALQPQQKVDVNMLARYYPFSAYEESRPKYADRYNIQDEGGAEDRGTGVVEPVVDVRWMARKLPNAMYQRLYFFPSEKKTAANKAELELCGKQWQKRVHVTLFIKDWYFGVSNNKLNVQGDFAELLKDPKKCISMEPRDLPTRFTEWLQRCHKMYDRENAMEAPYPAGQRPQGASSRSGVLYFQRVRFGSGEDGTWKKDEVVKILGRGSGGGGGGKRSSRASSGSGATSSMGGEVGGTAVPLKEFVVRISHFEVDEGDDLNMATSARVYYTRLPEDVFGRENMGWEDLSSLDPVKCKLKPEQAAGIEKEVRDRLARKSEVFYWDGVDKGSKEKMPKSVDWIAGAVDQRARKYENMLVMVKDGRGQALSELTSVIKGMYSVQLEVKRRGEGEAVVVEGASCSEMKTVDVDGPCYSFRLPPSLVAGRYLLAFSIVGPAPGCEKIGGTNNFNVTVNEEPAGEPTEAELDGLRSGSRGATLVFSEEMPLPAFSLLLKDHRNRSTTTESVTLCLELEKDNFSIEYRGKKGKRVQGDGAIEQASTGRSIKKRGQGAAAVAAAVSTVALSSFSSNICFKMNAEAAEEGIIFETGDWVLLPNLSKGPILGGETPETLKKAITIIVISAGEKLQNQRLKRELVIEPGLPVSLELVEPELKGRAGSTTPETALKISSETQVLPTLRFKALDVGGNVTAPGRTQRWGVELAMDEKGVRLVEPATRRNDPGWKVSPLGEVLLDGLSLNVTFKKEDKGRKMVTLEVTGTAGEESFSASPVHLAVEAQKGVPKRAWLEMKGEGILNDGMIASTAEEADDEEVEEEGEGEEVGMVRVKAGRKMKVLLPAGSTVLKPTVVVVDETGMHLDPAKVGMKVKATATSWSHTKELSDAAELPTLPGPTDKVIKIQVQVFHAKQTASSMGRSVAPAFLLEADIHPIPGEPDHISFTRDLAGPVRCGVSFNKQKSLIHYRDKFKNFLVVDPAHALPCPELQWTSSDKNIPMKQEPEGPLKTVLGEDGAYHLPTDVTLWGKAREIKLRVTAPKFTPMKSMVKLLPGPAHALKLVAPKHGVEVLSDKPAINLCRGEKLESLSIAFLDECGNRVNPPTDGVLSLFWNDRVSSRTSTAASRPSLTNPSPSELISKVVIGKEQQTGDPDNFIPPDLLALPTFVFNERRERVLRVELKAPGRGQEGGEVLCTGEMVVKTYLVNRVVGMRVVVGEATRISYPEERGVNDQRALTSPMLEKGLLQFKPQDRWDVDTGPPALGIVLETEDKEDPTNLNLSLNAGVFRVRVEREGTTRVHNEDWYKGVEVEEGVLTEDGKRVFVLAPSTDCTMGDPGNFQIRLSYLEQREHIKRVTPNKKDWQLDKPAIVYIQHGRAVGLRSEDSTLEAIALSASNNRDDPSARQILREARFYPIDQQGKRTRHESNLIVTVVTGPPGPPEVPPAGQGPCIVRGRVTAEPRQDIKTGLTTYLIPEISLEKDVGTESGSYRLKFDSPGLEPYFKTFDFTTDLERQLKIRRLNQELNPLRQEVMAWKHEVQGMEGQAHELTGRLHGELRYLHAQAGLFPRTPQGELPTSQELREAKAHLENGIRALRSQEVAVLRKRPGYLVPAVLSQGFKEVVTVGMVPDRRLAELLSWYATTRNMKAVICQTNADYKRVKLLQRDVTVYSLQDTEEFRSRDKTREQILKDKRLPLPPIDAKFNYRGHAVNMIVLREEDEHLRQSVFWSMFSNTVILGTEDDALAYREYCKHRGIRRPTILCYQDGRRLRASGPLDGEDKFGSSEARRLEFVFGGQDPQETEAFKAQLMAKDKVDELFVVYQELDVIRGQMQAKKQDVRMLELQKRVSAMELELKNILGNRV
ncbi:structural maintenance of chromosomes flexible hinge domain-containing protein 1-like [Nannochloropsis oceanica]